MDPFERMIEEGGGYQRWWGEKLWAIVPATVIVGQFLETFKEFPPSQPTASIKVEQVLEALQAGSAGGGH
jgi:arylsulfatase